MDTADSVPHEKGKEQGERKNQYQPGQGDSEQGGHGKREKGRETDWRPEEAQHIGLGDGMAESSRTVPEL